MLASLFALLLLGGCTGERTAVKLAVEDLAFQRINQGERIVSGVLHNEGERAVANALIRVALRDADNLPVDDLSITVTDIAPGERKPFRQVVDTSEDVQAASVSRILEF